MLNANSPTRLAQGRRKRKWCVSGNPHVGCSIHRASSGDGISESWGAHHDGLVFATLHATCSGQCAAK